MYYCFSFSNRSGSDPSKPSKPHPHSKHSHEDIHQKFTSSSASSLSHSHAAIHPYSSGSHSHTCTHPYSSSGSHSHTSIHPYSVVSDEMDELLSGSKSLCYVHTTHDRYNRLDDGHNPASLHPLCSSTSESISSQTHDQTSEPFHQNTPKVKHNQQSQQLWNPPQNEQKTEQLWDPPTENLQQHSHMTHDDRMTIIREDISRFRKSSNVTGSGSSSATTAAAVGSIPAVSSRWSKFMTESEEGEEEEEEEGDSVQTHMLHSRVAVARYN